VTCPPGDAEPGWLTAVTGHHGALLVVSPHLDDAALSCGALLAWAAPRAAVTVVTLFTEAGPPPYTLSARRYLHQTGAASAAELYRRRRSEDRAALAPLGIRCVHAGLTEAQFRRRPVRGWRRRWARVLPELACAYPIYRLHTISGRVAPSDAGTLREAAGIIAGLAAATSTLVVAPLGVGGHVDHVLARMAARRGGAPVVYYSDFPYNLRQDPDPAFIRRNGLRGQRWPWQPTAKTELILCYQSQVGALFPGGIPLVPETYFHPDNAGTGVP
jgi:LmbE family N-acetylglucosaminyl deacetylase